MPPEMHAQTLKAVTRAGGPFASVYVDSSHDTENAREHEELTWRSIRESLAADGAGDALLDTVTTALTAARPPVGRRGRALVANEQGVVLDKQLLQPPARQIGRFAELPYLVPIVDDGDDGSLCLVAAVDRVGVDITVRDAFGHVVQTAREDENRHPVHKARAGGQDRYTDTQSRVEEKIRDNLADAAARTVEVANRYRPDPVVVIGDQPARAEFLRLLPNTLGGNVVQLEHGSRASGIGSAEVSVAVDDLLTERRGARPDDICDRFRAETGRRDGLVATGIDDVGEALQQAAVEVLLLAQPSSQPVVLDAHTGPADEVLPYLAVQTDAEIYCVGSRLDPADGFAAILRHA